MEFETLINRGNTADARHAPIEVKETNGEEKKAYNVPTNQFGNRAKKMRHGYKSMVEKQREIPLFPA